MGLCNLDCATTFVNFFQSKNRLSRILLFLHYTSFSTLLSSLKRLLRFVIFRLKKLAKVVDESRLYRPTSNNSRQWSSPKSVFQSDQKTCLRMTPIPPKGSSFFQLFSFGFMKKQVKKDEKKSTLHRRR